MKRTGMPKIISFALVMFVFSLHAVELNPESSKDVANGAANVPKVWNPGGINGRWLPVGQPNLHNRNDKVIIRFPLAAFIAKGKVEKAVLRFGVSADKRNTRKEDLVLEHFTADRRELTSQTLITQEVEEVGPVAKLSPGASSDVKIDVSSAVNKDLAKGYVYVTFRVTSLTAEKFGAPENRKVNCASIEKKTIVLDVTP